MITRRNLCSIALAGLFPLAVSAADKKPRIAVVYVSRTGHKIGRASCRERV